MKFKSLIFFLLLFYTFSGLFAQDHQWPDGVKKIRIDSIKIKKNWRTKKMIIMNELGFNPGMIISKEKLDQGITRIWNIGNFSNVQYSIDTVQANKILLNVTAKDALTVVPIFSFSGNKDDYKLTLGIVDNNFLGKNLRVGLVGSYGTNVADFNLSVGIPRQLLYKNMALSGRISYGHNEKNQYTDGEKISGVGYTKKSLSINISNPWNEDFHYTFSPDLGISYFQHDTDSIFNHPGYQQGYKVNYISISTSESIGYIERMRHQKNGYRITGSLSGGIGLDNSSPGFFSLGLYANYYKLFNRFIQLSMHFSTAYTTSEIPSLKYYRGNNNVKGILYGEISGKAFYTAYLGGHFTYVNRNWFAMEQSFFINLGNGANHYPDIYTSAPLGSVGTGIKLMIPMIPWINASFFYTIGNGSNNGFSIQL